MNLLVAFRYLVALDDHRHFGRAALACHVTQPALSNALRSLEESYGTTIVKRDRAFAGFTVEGLRVLESARRILREQEGLEQDLRGGADDPTGHLLIGAVPTAMPVAAHFVALLQERHPRVVPSLRSMSSIELESGLENLALDLGLGYTERLEKSVAPLKRVPQYEERYYLLRRARDPHAPLAIAAPMPWRDAARLPLCLLSAEMHNRTIIDRAFARAGVHPAPAIETNSILTLVSSVAAGSVSSIMPGALMGTARGHAGMEVAPLVEPEVATPIAFMFNEAARPSRTQAAALAFAQDPGWLAHAAAEAGAA